MYPKGIKVTDAELALERIRMLIGEYVNETQRRIDYFESFQNAAD